MSSSEEEWDDPFAAFHSNDVVSEEEEVEPSYRIHDQIPPGTR